MRKLPIPTRHRLCLKREYRSSHCFLKVYLAAIDHLCRAIFVCHNKRLAKNKIDHCDVDELTAFGVGFS